MTTAYLAADGFAEPLPEELQRAGASLTQRHERLFICQQPVASAWAANIWHDCVELPVESIGSAAQALRDIQRNWAMYAPLHHRRAALVQERLPPFPAKPRRFPTAAPKAPLAHGRWRRTGCWPPRAAARPSPTARWPSSRTGRSAQSRLPEIVGGPGAAGPVGRASAASISAPRPVAGPPCWPSWAPR